MEALNKIILLVEDDSFLLEALSKKFNSLGYTVFQAKNGKEGLQLALDTHPDIVLLDIIMPIMDGVTMIKELRKDTWGKTVPVVFSTNVMPNDKTNEMVAQNEPSYYLIKSDTSIDEVVKKVSDVLALPIKTVSAT